MNSVHEVTLIIAMNNNQEYTGFELGPIRPPSESGSLLLRVTRNCPWNRCRFCGLYKGEKFSMRPPEHVMRDIDRVAHFTALMDEALDKAGGSRYQALKSISGPLDEADRMALFMADGWMQSGQESVFLQDANTLIMKPSDLAAVLAYLKETFPNIKRTTSYARSQTISAMKDADMEMLKNAGLTRIHTGMESGCDAVLDMVKKGVDRRRQIEAGQRVKRAGIELSEYYMPGLGGVKYMRDNALDTAEAMNAINPDFIRLRTLAVPEYLELYADVADGSFEKCTDIQTAQEVFLFLENLHGITSTIKSDHILNLFQEVEGKLPGDAEKMREPIKRFLGMDVDKQLLYVAGRRACVFNRLDDMDDPYLMEQAEKTVRAHGVTHENLQSFCESMTARFI